MSPAKKKAGKPPPKKPKQQIVVITEQPTTIVQTTVPPSTAKSGIWDAVANIRMSLFYGFWIGVGLMPIGAHIISQFYCGVGEKLRCNPVEFPAWLEAGGIVVALAFANAAKDVVSKSFGQLFEAAKGLPALLRRDPPAGG